MSNMIALMMITLLSSGLDLPIQPPELRKDTPAEAPPEMEDVPEYSVPEGDDPRDTPPPVIYGEEIDCGSDTIVFVVDRSFSMHNGSGWIVDLQGNRVYATRMLKAKVELSRCISSLASNFRFNVISYACRVTQWTVNLQPADPPNKMSALDWIRRLDPVGGTATGPATALGLSFLGNSTVVLLTDGAPNCGASGTQGHLSMILSANTQGARITVFAINPVRNRFRAFCQAIASCTGGSYIEIS